MSADARRPRSLLELSEALRELSLGETVEVLSSAGWRVTGMTESRDPARAQDLTRQGFYVERTLAEDDATAPRVWGHGPWTVYAISSGPSPTDLG